MIPAAALPSAFDIILLLSVAVAIVFGNENALYVSTGKFVRSIISTKEESEEDRRHRKG